MKRRQCLQCAAALALGGPLALRAAVSDEQAFDALDLDWTDAKRQRPVPVRVSLSEVLGVAEVATRPRVSSPGH
jgi:hypothetical protein